MIDRRRFLAGASLPALASLSPLARAAASAWQPAELPAGAVAEGTLESLPGKVPLIKRSFRPPNYETPIEFLGDPLTRNDAFFVRYHLAGIPQKVDAKAWRLAIGGAAAGRKLEYDLATLKREFEPAEIVSRPWKARAEEAGVTYEEFVRVAKSLNERKVIGRFSTFLEHVKPSQSGARVTRYNALFHWKVPEGREIEAGREVGRHHILTHAYWREGGSEFAGVNIMAVAHGTDKALVLAHKDAIDKHLEEVGIPVTYTNVFWGGRSEIKPSEIAPGEYVKWCIANGVDPDSMRGVDERSAA
jgi:hypothetical protein